MSAKPSQVIQCRDVFVSHVWLEYIGVFIFSSVMRVILLLLKTLQFYELNRKDKIRSVL